MANTPRWKGTNDFKEQPTSPVFENTKDGPKMTRTFRGPYAKLVSDQPQRLAVMVGSPSDFKVDSVRIAKQPGGSGEMTVVLTPAPIEDYTFENNEVLEVEWLEVSKKLEEHPFFLKAEFVNGATNGTAALTADDLDKIAAWKNASGVTDRVAAWGTLSANAKIFVNYLKVGVDSYVQYAPVARRTTKYSAAPTLGKCGRRSNPPAAIKIDGYEYLKTADRLTKDRTWTRVEEWTGALYVDHTLYPAS